MLQRALDCFQTTLTDFVLSKKHVNHWKIGFRRPLSHILCVYISCFRGLWFVFGQHSYTLCFLKIMWIIEKSVFVNPSHTFCLSRYDASDGFGLFSDNTHTLCGLYKYMNQWKICFRKPLSHIVPVIFPLWSVLISPSAMRCIAIQQGRYLEIRLFYYRVVVPACISLSGIIGQ